ncbi:MAG TPA: ferritin-like domain-containing protein [Candidatus Polarisedimenticolia bacterium]|nr:ferritin-like domain-containing protein [Candidatus Polarisedimenticolia bacterium]
MTGIPGIELGALGLDRGAHLLLKHALRQIPVGAPLDVFGSHQDLAVHLRAWCRAQGHEITLFPDGQGSGPAARIVRGSAETGRWKGAESAGAPDRTLPGGVVDKPPARWGLAARGAKVEAGGPAFDFPLSDKDVVWADEAAALYAQAAAAQWDPATAVDWTAPITHPPEIEDAVVQVMTFLVENETAALIVPASFLAKIHPHFREVLQLLAIQAADEARHIECFTRRALLVRKDMGLSTVGGQESLKTLLEEPDFALAFFLLSVLGEGSFLSLLWFLHESAPDPVTREVCRLAAQDEARHVAFGLAHLRRHMGLDPGLRPRLAAAVERRHEALRNTDGLNEEVFDALVLLAAGSWEIEDLGTGHDRVVALRKEMDLGRRQRLEKLGFPVDEAEALSALHTRNFM